MIAKITTFAFIFFYFLLPAHACTCASSEGKGFCDYIDYAEYVVDANVIERMNDQGRLRLRVNEVFKGNSQVPNEIILQNVMCSTWLTEELGGRFILGLSKSSFDTTANVYLLPLCGIYHLQIDGNRIKGDISKNKKSMSYNAFRELITTQACPASVPSFSVFIENQTIQLATRFERFEGDIPIRLYSISGQVVSSFNLQMQGRLSEEKRLDKVLSPGIYVVYIDLGGVNVQVEKVLIR